MKDPRRLVDEGASDVERDLLESWQGQRAPSAGRKRLLGLSLGAAATTHATASAASKAIGNVAGAGSASTNVVSASLSSITAKWVVAGAIVTTVSGASLLSRTAAVEPSHPAVVGSSEGSSVARMMPPPSEGSLDSLPKNEAVFPEPAVDATERNQGSESFSRIEAIAPAASEDSVLIAPPTSASVTPAPQVPDSRDSDSRDSDSIATPSASILRGTTALGSSRGPHRPGAGGPESQPQGLASPIDSQIHREGVREESASSKDALSLAPALTALRTIREELAAGRTREALVRLDAFEVRFGESSLAEEAAILRFDAHVKLGEHDAARRVARAILSKNPRSSYANRLRRALATEP